MSALPSRTPVDQAATEQSSGTGQSTAVVLASRERVIAQRVQATYPRLTPNADPQQAGHSIGEVAYTYAAGSPDRESARRYGRSVTWTCHSCDNAISDRGLSDGPADDEHGHADNCPRLNATIATWDAEWEDLEADREAASDRQGTAGIRGSS